MIFDSISSPAPKEGEVVDDLAAHLEGLRVAPCTALFSPDAAVTKQPFASQIAKENIDDDESIHEMLSKRGSDHITIEGSPFRTHSKRIDAHATPLFVSSAILKPIEPSLLSAVGSLSQEKASRIADTKTGNAKKVRVIVSGGKHDTGNHQENFKRLALLVGEDGGCLGRVSVAEHVDIVDDTKLPRKASLADLIRVHEYEYLSHLEQKARAADGLESSQMPSFYAPPGHLDLDTPLGGCSLDAAKCFCGAALSAVDYVMSGSGDRALVLGRPPGHHAGASGCVVSNYYWRRPDMSSSGFCLLNTVAVAAAYARYMYGSMTSSYRKSPPKIAIVDFDIHHGNGTEDIVRNLKPRTVHLPLPSSWAPISKQIYKPWLNEQDADDTLFASINLAAEDRFYPCSGAGATEGNIINIGLTPQGPGPWDQKARVKLSSKDRAELCKIASTEFRTKINETLIPALRRFRPDLLLFSAGFDGHVDDFYHFLTEADFHWVTEQLCTITEESGGAVVSVLEGGYSLSSPIPSTRTTKASTKTPHAAADHESVKFAQQSGDGGLVKGMLAHVAALARKDAW